LLLKNKNNFFCTTHVAQVAINYIYKKYFKTLIRTKDIPKVSSICYTLYINEL